MPNLPGLLLLLLLPACAGQRAFAPVENLDGVGPGDVPAAVYRLPDEDPHHVEVRIWSRGARTEVVEGKETTVVRARLELTNLGASPVSIDQGSITMERIAAASAPAPPAGALAPFRVLGEAAAAPGGATRVEFLFAPGAGLAPRDIEGFDLRWRVVGEGRTLLERATPFAKYIPEVDWFYDDDEYSFFIGCPRGHGR